jgi:hypothetical protein
MRPSMPGSHRQFRRPHRAGHGPGAGISCPAMVRHRRHDRSGMPTNAQNWDSPEIVEGLVMPLPVGERRSQS